MRHNLVIEVKKLDEKRPPLKEVSPITDVIHKKTQEIWQTRKALFEDPQEGQKKLHLKSILTEKN